LGRNARPKLNHTPLAGFACDQDAISLRLGARRHGGQGEHDDECDSELPHMYFQFLAFPSAIHSTACLMRRARVSSPLASVIHSMYSRLWLGLNLSYVASAFLFFLIAARK